MHKLAVAFFYACALLSLSVTALVFIGKASAQDGGHVSRLRARGTGFAVTIGCAAGLLVRRR
jgi:hypothetical protein